MCLCHYRKRLFSEIIQSIVLLYWIISCQPRARWLRHSPSARRGLTEGLIFCQNSFIFLGNIYYSLSEIFIPNCELVSRQPVCLLSLQVGRALSVHGRDSRLRGKCLCLRYSLLRVTGGVQTLASVPLVTAT